jgi:hypothetical protein
MDHPRVNEKKNRASPQVKNAERSSKRGLSKRMQMRKG